MARRGLALFAAGWLLATAAAVGESGSGPWTASKALKLTIGNGISSGVSLWRAADREAAELRVMVVRQADTVYARGIWLRVGDDSQLVTCSRIEASFFRTEGFRSCFGGFAGFEQARTISRCPLEWSTSQRILDGAPVELQIDTEIKLLKRKRLSPRQLARLTALRPMG